MWTTISSDVSIFWSMQNPGTWWPAIQKKSRWLFLNWDNEPHLLDEKWLETMQAYINTKQFFTFAYFLNKKSSWCVQDFMPPKNNKPPHPQWASLSLARFVHYPTTPCRLCWINRYRSRFNLGCPRNLGSKVSKWVITLLYPIYK